MENKHSNSTAGFKHAHPVLFEIIWKPCIGWAVLDPLPSDCLGQ